MRDPAPLGRYRLPLRCQAIVTVTLPNSSKPTNNRIMAILLSASVEGPGYSPGLSRSKPLCSFREPALPLAAGKVSSHKVPPSAPDSLVLRRGSRSFPDVSGGNSSGGNASAQPQRAVCRLDGSPPTPPDAAFQHLRPAPPPTKTP